MANTKIEYLGMYGIDNSKEQPSAIIRRIRGEETFVIEICTETLPWREDSDLVAHFWGLTDGSFPIEPKIATEVVSSWQGNWFT